MKSFLTQYTARLPVQGGQPRPMPQYYHKILLLLNIFQLYRPIWPLLHYLVYFIHYFFYSAYAIFYKHICVTYWLHYPVF